ncbi:MAG TPA: PilZ domain-containing protein [Candidatus Dormibacteraeota bacterium]|nr:PilZ domain-containing protein [Candidatus Dormibacteraeota bacterium]
MAIRTKRKSHSPRKSPAKQKSKNPRVPASAVSGARKFAPTRSAERFPQFRDLTVQYEGSSRAIAPRTPDISTAGMFINTTEHFPEGAVVKIGFRLARTRKLIEVRGEVRYCLQGVGIGVEYLDLGDSARKAIAAELRA